VFLAPAVVVETEICFKISAKGVPALAGAAGSSPAKNAARKIILIRIGIPHKAVIDGTTGRRAGSNSFFALTLYEIL
jgi:hypothetical protein